jgi:hypothetical protein
VWGTRSFYHERELSHLLRDKMRGEVGGTYGRDEESDQSPSNTRILRCALSGSRSTYKVMYLVPNQSRACTDEQRQG